MADIDAQPVIGSLVADNLKSIAGQSASLANLALANAVSFQQSMNQVQLSNASRAADVLYVDPMAKAVASSEYKQGNLASQAVQTLGAVATGQQATKAAQSTPPETATP